MKRRSPRIAAALLATAMAVGQAVPALAAEDLTNHWAGKYLSIWQNYGVMQGDENGNINPDKPATRAELATMLNAVMGYQVKASNRFLDVDSNSWYADPILKACAAGVFTGDAAGTMRPNDQISRQEAMAVLSSVLELDTSSAPAGKFNDYSSVASWAKPYVNAMAAKGYVGGDDQGNFRPESPITRAEIATIFTNIFTTYLNQSGVYSKDVEGNLVVKAQDVELKDLTVTGNLIIAEGVADGDVELKNVTVQGKLLVRGGGDNSVVIGEGCDIGAVEVARQGDTVRVDVSKDAKIGSFTVVEGAKGVELSGTLQTVTVEATKASIEVTGTVAALNVVSDHVSVQVASGATVTKLTTSAAGTEVKGAGKVTTLVAEKGSSGVKVSTSGTKVENKSSSDVTTSSGTVKPGESGTSSSTGGSTSGGGGGSSSGGGSDGGNTETETATIDVTPTNVIEKIAAKKDVKNLTVNFAEGDYSQALQDAELTFNGTQLTLNFNEAKGLGTAFTLNVPRATEISLNDAAGGEDGARFEQLTINAPNAHVENSVAFDNVVVEAVATGTFAAKDKVGHVELKKGSVEVQEGAGEVDITIPTDASGETKVKGSVNRLVVNSLKNPVTVEATAKEVSVRNNSAAATEIGSAALNLAGKVESLSVETKAAVSVAKEAVVETVKVNEAAAGTELKGEGKITNCNVKAEITINLGAVTTINTTVNIVIEGATQVGNVDASGATAQITITINGSSKVEVVVDPNGNVTVGGDTTEEKPQEVTIKKVELVEGYNPTYYYGDKLDLTGLKLKVTYSNDTTSELVVKGNDLVKVDSTNLEDAWAGTTETVTVSYGGFSVRFNVAVQRKPVVEATIEGLNQPVVGGRPATITSVRVPEYGPYVSELTWTGEMDANKNFAAGTVYTAHVTLSIDDNYIFDKAFRPIVADGIVRVIASGEEEIQFTVTFDKTEDESTEPGIQTATPSWNVGYNEPITIVEGDSISTSIIYSIGDDTILNIPVDGYTLEIKKGSEEAQQNADYTFDSDLQEVTFKETGTYTITATLKDVEGIKWANDGKLTRKVDVKSQVETIALVELSGLKQPVAGEKPVYQLTANDNRYTAGTIKWDGTMTSTGAFNYNTTYTAEVILTANSGYAFADNVSVSGVNTTPSAVTSGDGKTLTITVPFVETGSPDESEETAVPGWEIGHQDGATVNFKVGDTLSTGIVYHLSNDTSLIGTLDTDHYGIAVTNASGSTDIASVIFDQDQNITFTSAGKCKIIATIYTGETGYNWKKDQLTLTAIVTAPETPTIDRLPTVNEWKKVEVYTLTNDAEVTDVDAAYKIPGGKTLNLADGVSIKNNGVFTVAGNLAGVGTKRGEVVNNNLVYLNGMDTKITNVTFTADMRTPTMNAIYVSGDGTKVTFTDVTLADGNNIYVLGQDVELTFVDCTVEGKITLTYATGKTETLNFIPGKTYKWTENGWVEEPEA